MSCNTRYNRLMIKTLFKCKGWIAAEPEYTFDGVKVKLRVDTEKRFCCHRCGRRGYIHSVRRVCIKDLPCIGEAVEIELEVPQVRCPKCGHFHTLRPDFVHPSMGFTWRFMQEISDLFVHVPARWLAKLFGTSPATVRRIDKEILARELPAPRLEGIEGILVDEKYLGPSFGFVTLVLHARTGEPLYMAAGKDAGALEGFFEKLSREQREGIRFLGIDRANAYRAAALKHLPNVQVCYDAYHLVSNMNEVVDKVRRKEMAHPTEAMRRLLSGKRYHLLRARENLDDDGRRELRELLAFNANLNTAYVLKEQFRTIFQQPDENAALLQLTHWVRMSVASGIELMEKFARGISAKTNEVINGIRHRINSARIESANAGIKRIQAKCCGLFNIDYLFLKMRQIFFLRPPMQPQRI